jgi:hypothetical protein
MSTPELHLSTLFVLNAQGRIVATREPYGTRGPLFTLVRSSSGCVWAVRDDVPSEIAVAIGQFAQQELPHSELQTAPGHRAAYLSLLRSWLGGAQMSESAGPAFVFPDSLMPPTDVQVIEDETLLDRNFKGWKHGEIAVGRAPVMAIVEGGFPVSVCFCARLSDVAAEGGVETAEPFRGRGFGPRVTAAWALAIRASGRIPLYSTSWDNAASLAVARKLGLRTYASGWSVCDRDS